MISAKMIGLFALPAVLMAVLWFVAFPDAETMRDPTLRLAGIVLLGIAFLAIILVFRATAASAEPPLRRIDPAAPACNEFRRGFASATVRSRKPQLRRPGVVVALHCRRIEQRRNVSKPSLSPVVASETIETLSRRLHDRAEKLWKRHAV